MNETLIGRMLACLVVTLSLFVHPQALGAGPLEVYVDQNPVTVGTSLTLTVRVQGTPSGGIKLPDLPKSVSVRGPSQRSVTNIVNFEVERFQEFTFYLTPREPGVLKFGSIVTMIDGKLYKSDPFDIRVIGSKSQASKQEIFAKAQAAPKSVYPGEQLIYSFSLFRDPSIEVSQFRYAAPSFEGFIEENMGDLGEKTTIRNIDGRRYALQEVRHALFPTRRGDLEIGDATLMVDVVRSRKGRRRGSDPFGSLFGNPFDRQVETREVYAPAIPVKVKPLPEGAPPSFDGLVGDFKVNYRLSQNTVATGESVTLTVTVLGEGNLRGLSLPEWDAGPFKLYPDTPELTSRFDPATLMMTSSKTFKIALIALEVGEVQVKAPAISWLDPKSGRYRTQRPPPLKLTVTQGTKDESINALSAPRNTPQDVEILGEDIRPLKGGAGISRPLALTPRSPLALALFFGPGLLFLGLALRERASRREQDPALLRRKNALQEAQRALTVLSEGSTKGLEATRELDRILRSYIGDKLGLEGLALTPTEVGRALEDAGIDEGLKARVEACLKELESAQFAPGGPSDGALAGHRQEIDAILKALEGAL